MLWVYKFILIFFSCILMRLFVFEISYVSSESMENTLFKGDVIFINKLIYGPVVPQRMSEIPWLNIFCGNKAQEVSDSEYKRLTGYSEIKRNHTVVFKPLKIEDMDNYIKRCVALPGDRIKISSSELYINEKLIPKLPNVKNKYRVFYIGSQETFFNLSKKVGFEYYPDLDERRSIYKTVFLTEDQKKTLQSTYKITRIDVDESKGDEFKSMTLNKNNFVVNDKGKSSPKRTSQNMFFMMGDNRNLSIDSRFFGPIPESHIVGKATMILFAIDPHDNSILLNRLFKFIN